MKKILKYSLIYELIMFIGHYIKIIGIPSIFDFSFLLLIAYNFLAIKIGIINNIDKNKDIIYKDNTLKFIFITSLFNTILCLLVNLDIGITFSHWSVFMIINAIELFIVRPKQQSIDITTKKNIEGYFQNKKRQ